ncbi:recombinase family protein [Candidatus Ventrimonas sp. KK005]
MEHNMTQDYEKDFGKSNGILTQPNGTVYGYGRVSTKEQNSARQKEVLQNKCDVYFEDKLSGKNMERPQFKEMFSLLKSGDTVVVVSIDRLGRNLKELVEFSSKLKEMGVNIIALNQGIDTHTKMGELFYNLMAIFADLELEFIKERQRAGIEVAKKEGRYKGRPVKELKDWEQISQEVDNKELSIDRACKLLGISRSSYYRRKRLEETNNKIVTISDNTEIDF